MKLSLAIFSALSLVVPSLAAPLSDNELDKRAWNCKGNFQCRGKRIPPNSSAVCQNNICTYACNSGFTRSGVFCVAPAEPVTSTTSDAASSSSTVSTDSPEPTWSAVSSATSDDSTPTSTWTASIPGATIIPNALAVSQVTSFLGINTGAIASWYHASSTQDSTNGHSWCYYPYNDDTPGFAISLKTMLDNFDGDAFAARKAYCGLEAIVTNPDGTEMTLYVADAFDDAWVLTPTSIDVMYNAFSTLFGRVTTNKNDVVKNASWRFTGNRNQRYAFNSVGN